MGTWGYGSMGAREQGSMLIRKLVGMGAREHWNMGAWKHGSMGAWERGSKLIRELVGMGAWE